MKKRLKKRFLFFLAAVLVIFLVIYIWPFVFRHHYTEEDRVNYDVYYGAGELVLTGVYTLKSAAKDADLIIEATVLTNGVEKEQWPSKEVPGAKSRLHGTLFKLKVDEIWHGEYDKATIDVLLRGTIPANGIKPLRGDKILIMIQQRENDLIGVFNQTSMGDERGVYIINPPDNSVFSLSREDVFTVYDGTSPAVIRQIIDNLLDSRLTF